MSDKNSEKLTFADTFDNLVIIIVNDSHIHTYI